MQDTHTLSGTPIRARVATAIRVEMARRQISQTRLAEMAGMRQAVLSRRMTGETAFDLDDLDRLATALGVPVSSLVA